MGKMGTPLSLNAETIEGVPTPLFGRLLGALPIDALYNFDYLCILNLYAVYVHYEL